MSHSFIDPKKNYYNVDNDSDTPQKKIDPVAQLKWLNTPQVHGGWGLFNLPAGRQGNQPAQMFAQDKNTKNKNVDSVDSGSVSGDEKALKWYSKLKQIVDKKIEKYQKKVDSGKTKHEDILNKWKEVKHEFDILENSETMYYIKSGVSLKSEIRDGQEYSTQGQVNFNKDTNQVQINISKNVSLWKVTLIHELKHAYQYEEGKISMFYSSGQGNSVLTDLTDEEEAFKRGALFSSEYKESDVNEKFLREKGYKNENVEKSLDTYNSEYCKNNSEILKEANYNQGLAGNKPMFVYKGWEKDYQEGVKERKNLSIHDGNPIKIDSKQEDYIWDYKDPAQEEFEKGMIDFNKEESRKNGYGYSIKKL